MPVAEKDKTIKTSDIVQFLRAKYEHEHVAPEWISADELKMGLGYEGNDNVQRIDFWAMHCWKQQNYKRIAYEIKVSRGDFLKELKNPQKRRMAMLVSNYFYFVAPKGLIKPEEVPLDCGLIEIGWTDNQKSIDYASEWNSTKMDKYPYRPFPVEVPEYREFLGEQTIVEAPWRDTPAPSWKFFASFARKLTRLATVVSA